LAHLGRHRGAAPRTTRMHDSTRPAPPRRVGVARIGRPPFVPRRRLSNQRHVLCLAKNVAFPSHRTRGGRRGPTHMAVPLDGGREHRALLPLCCWLQSQRFWCSSSQQSSHQPSCLPTDTSWEQSAKNMCFVLTYVGQSQAPMVHLHLGWSCISKQAVLTLPLCSCSCAITGNSCTAVLLISDSLLASDC